VQSVKQHDRNNVERVSFVSIQAFKILQDKVKLLSQFKCWLFFFFYRFDRFI